jgi:hypothetical protein
MVEKMREDVLKMREFFDTTLPGTLLKYNLVVGFSPKFSDFRDRQFARYPFDVHYGLAEGWELFGGWTPYSPNPIKSGLDHRWGTGFTNIGIRHDVGRFFQFYDKVTVAFEISTPLGQPPGDIIDRYSHLRPSIAASRALPVPHLTFFTNYSYDQTVDTPGRVIPPPGTIRRDVIDVAPGLLYKPGEFGEFANYDFQHINDNRGIHYAHNYKIGVIWDPPLTRTKGWHLPGKWQVELAYKVNREQGVSNSNDFAATVRWRTTLKEMYSWTQLDRLNGK